MLYTICTVQIQPRNHVSHIMQIVQLPPGNMSYEDHADQGSIYLDIELISPMCTTLAAYEVICPMCTTLAAPARRSTIVLSLYGHVQQTEWRRTCEGLVFV